MVRASLDRDKDDSGRSVTRAKAVNAKRTASLWKSAGLGPRRIARSVTHEVRARNFLGRASELAFDFLFALFPLILFLLALFALFASRSAELQLDFLSFFADFLPRTAFDLLEKTTRELAASAGGGKLTVGILMAVWFASGGVSSMIGALNLAYRVDEARSWIRVRLAAIGLTIVISILLFAALVLLLASGHFIDRIAAYFCTKGAGIGLRRVQQLAFWHG
jgi:membrane protein